MRQTTVVLRLHRRDDSIVNWVCEVFTAHDPKVVARIHLWKLLEGAPATQEE